MPATATSSTGRHCGAAQATGASAEASESVAGARAATLYAELGMELGELSERVGDRWRHDMSGSASLLYGMSAHWQQRTTTSRGVRLGKTTGPCSYAARYLVKHLAGTIDKCFSF